MNPPPSSLGNLAPAQAAEKEGRYTEAWSLCLKSIQERPFHPEAYIQMASIAISAGDLDTATQAAKQATLLTPQWKTASDLLARLQSIHPDPSRLLNPGVLVLPQVENYPRLSVCLIVKNEERFLAQCLRSIQRVAHEIIVVDTGSDDKTVEIAQSMGAQVIHFQWCDDFSAARNACLAQARGDWILVLDADEELNLEDENTLLQELKTSTNKLLLRLQCVQTVEEKTFKAYVPRLFRNAPFIQFQDAVHESVTNTVVGLCDLWGMELGVSQSRLIHHGYSKEVIRDKNKIGRNHRLLLKAIEQNPGNAYMQMQLGSEYLRLGEMPKAFEHFEVAKSLCEKEERLLPDSVEGLLTLYGTNLLKEGNAQKTEALFTSPLSNRFPLTPWHLYLRGRARHELKNYRLALQDLKACWERRNEETLYITPADLNNPELECLIGETHLALGEISQAEIFFRKAHQTEPSSAKYTYAVGNALSKQNRFQEALGFILENISGVQNPLPLWVLGASIALGQDGLQDFALEWLENALAQYSEDQELLTLYGAALIQSERLEEAYLVFRQLPWGTSPKSLGGLLFSGICENAQDLPKLNAALEKQAAMAIYSVIQHLQKRDARHSITRFSTNIARYATQFPYLKSVFYQSPGES